MGYERAGVSDEMFTSAEQRVWDSVVIPGERLGIIGQHQSSAGTYALGDHIYASVLGHKRIQPPSQGSAATEPAATGSTTSKQQTPMIQVTRRKDPSAIPEIDSVVTCKVLRVNPRFATLSILVVGTTPVRETFQGIVRVSDVRATEKDKVQIYKSFRPGDIVRAVVISLGDSRAYYLSTARNDLGVIFAQSAAGHTMVPVSWEEMACPVTKVIEFRKTCNFNAQ